MLVPRMLDDSFKLTIDKIYGNDFDITDGGTNFDRKDINYETYINNQKLGIYPVVNYKDDENMWQYIG